MEAAQSLLQLRPWSPYRFGGKWFVGYISGQAHALRTKAQLMQKAAKAGLTAIDMVEVGG